MGFFDKVKALKNVITGGGAKVYLSTTPVSLGEPFEVTIRAQVQDADLKIDRVYIEIEGREEVEVQDVDVVYESDGDTRRRREIVRAQTTTVELEIEVAEGQTLDANDTYEWTVTAELPADAPPVYQGHNCLHNYHIRGSLDCFGNDPDSGWQELELV